MFRILEAFIACRTIRQKKKKEPAPLVKQQQKIYRHPMQRMMHRPEQTGGRKHKFNIKDRWGGVSMGSFLPARPETTGSLIL